MTCSACNGEGYERVGIGGGTVCGTCGGSGEAQTWCVWCHANVSDGHTHDTGKPSASLIRIMREDAAQLRGELESDARDEAFAMDAGRMFR